MKKSLLVVAVAGAILLSGADNAGGLSITAGANDEPP